MVIENVFQWLKFFLFGDWALPALAIRGEYLTWSCSFLSHLVISQNSPDFLFISFAFSHINRSFYDLTFHWAIFSMNERTKNLKQISFALNIDKKNERMNITCLCNHINIATLMYASTELCFIDFLNIETWWLFDYNKMRDV